MNQTVNNQIEIDVFSLVKKLWSKKFFIVFVSLLFGTMALLASMYMITPKYTSTTRLYVVNQNNTETSLSAQDLQAGSYLARDYQEIILSKDVMTEVITSEKLDLTVDELASLITVSNPTDTRVISISVEDASSKRAAKVANAIREAASQKIKEVTKVEEVTTLEKAEEASKPSSPNLKRNTILGVLLGGFLAIFIVVLKEVLDDHVKSPEDIEEILGYTLLGVIPNFEKL